MLSRTGQQIYPLSITLFSRITIPFIASRNGINYISILNGKNIPFQRSSEIFASITEEAKSQFFRLQGKRRTDIEYWAYDIMSISSYSEGLRQVQYDRNKEGDPMAQLNLALVFGEISNPPFYYRKLAVNIPDTKMLTNLLADLDTLGFLKVKLVMDRGFYSEANINLLFKSHLKFLIPAKMSLSFIRQELDGIMIALHF